MHQEAIIMHATCDGYIRYMLFATVLTHLIGNASSVKEKPYREICGERPIEKGVGKGTPIWKIKQSTSLRP